jgi:uncharacterized membrane protein YoaK (UPF0700 family)
MAEPLPPPDIEDAPATAESLPDPPPKKSWFPHRFQSFRVQDFIEASDRIPSTATSALLAAAGGYLDAFTYVGHGHVFANAMTGNVVLLGVNCIGGDWHTGLRHLPPILAFVVGICAAKAIEQWAAQRQIRFRYLAVLALEIGILAALSFLPPSTADFWITISIAFAASVQVETFRRVHNHSYNSTFTTGNLRTLAEGIFDWFAVKRTPETAEQIRDFAMICGSFLAGAIAGGLATPLAMTHGILNRALWIDIMLLFIVAVRVWPRQRA